MSVIEPAIGDQTQDGQPHQMRVRVYYEDTDFSGFVYHASYLRFLERGRTELLRGLAGDQSDLHREAQGLVFVVRRMNLDFVSPARMDDLLTILTHTKALRGASMQLVQEVRRGDMLLVAAEVTVACVRDGRAVRLPEVLRRRLAPAE